MNMVGNEEGQIYLQKRRKLDGRMDKERKKITINR